jgi:hypothetical protein
VPPRATPNLRPPDAPTLPYHFVTQPAPMPGQKFGNVSGVALTPQGHVLVFNRNPVMMMVEYDAQGKFLRTFNPNIAVNTHGMRVDRYGNIWILDAFLNVLWKLKPSGEPIMTVGTRGEVAKWDDATWNGMFNVAQGAWRHIFAARLHLLLFRHGRKGVVPACKTRSLEQAACIDRQVREYSGFSPARALSIA